MMLKQCKSSVLFTTPYITPYITPFLLPSQTTQNSTDPLPYITPYITQVLLPSPTTPHFTYPLYYCACVCVCVRMSISNIIIIILITKHMEKHKVILTCKFIRANYSFKCVVELVHNTLLSFLHILRIIMSLSRIDHNHPGNNTIQDQHIVLF